MFNRYREIGLSLIPIKPGEKRPLETNWSQFCDRLPTETECEAWEARGHQSYGLALGPASGVMFVDIDSDDAKVLNAVKPSPIRKRGKKGESRAFRFDPNVPSTKIAGIIDILAYGRQTVLPPTVHPETGKPYFWLTPDTLENFNTQDLPLFTIDDLDDLRRALGEPVALDISDAGVNLKGPFYNDDPKRTSPHGSQDRLKRICNALIARGASPDEAVREILRYDEENHKPVGYFFEAGRTSDQFADPVSNALFFYASNVRTFNKRQVREKSTPVAPMVSGSEILEISIKETTDAVVAAPGFKATPWPEPKGGLKEIRDLILKLSIREQFGVAMGGAVALGSVAIANRIRLGNVWPNVYVLNVAPTGVGKSFPYMVIKRILTPENGLDLVGSGGYRSSSAMIKDLISRRERLDLIDECSGTFRTIRDGGVFQQDMLDILNSLWSDSGSSFLGPEAAAREKVAVWHACISALFSTTPQGLKGSINSNFVTQGLLPRCIIFHDPEYGPMRKKGASHEEWDEKLAGTIITRLLGLKEKFGNTEASGKRNIMGGARPNPDPILITSQAEEMLNDYQRDCAERLAETNREEVERHFLSRGGQQATKLALIHGALWRMSVDIEDVEWAIHTLRTSWDNAAELLPTLGAENLQETNVLKVLHIIKKAGQIQHAALIQKTRFLKTNERNEILSSLEAEGKIRPLAMNHTTKKGKLWTVVAS